MRWRDLTIWLICLLMAAGLLITAAGQLDYINSQRREMRLISNEPLENAPPSLAFATVAMGAFRGLVVDILWLRADRLKQEGQFFDAKQIAEWITMLQPRFATVWQFHAWNMAYNISVAIPVTQPDQRWHWVKSGFELLRDKGIPLNPKSIILYQELARIFQHKIGGVTDDAHKYYKLQLALAMEPLLGDATNNYFNELAKALKEFEQIIADVNVAAFVNALETSDQAFSDRDNFVSNYLTLRQNPDRFDPNAFEVIDNFRGTYVLKKFDFFAKANYLRNTWKLEPAFMQQLNETYGPVDYDEPNSHLPLDWRHPDAHAIYWAVKGLQLAGGEFSADEANTDRTVNHGLQNLFRYGKIFIYDVPAFLNQETRLDEPPPATKEVYVRSDLRMFDTYNKSVMAVLEKYKDTRGQTYESMQIGHRNMLKNAVFSFYQSGHIPKAAEIYGLLRKLYPLDEFKVPVMVYVRNRMREEIEKLGYTDVKEMVQMMLRESYFRYAVRDDDEAYAREKMAKEVHDLYQTRFDDEHRIDLPDFKLMRYFALMDFFNDPQYPHNLRQNLVARIKIERPDLAKQLEQLEDKIQKQLQQQEEKTQQ